MNIWNKYRIGDCCEVTSSKRVFLADYVESGIPFYRSKEIAELQSCTPITTPLYISEEKYKDIKTKYGIPQKGDLLLTAIGATLGIPYLIKDNEPFYFKDGNLIWFKNFNPQLSSEYLYLWMVSSYGYDSMQNVAIGSAQKALTIAALKDIAIEIPPIEIQKKISCVLTAYDNLIENNNKRIRLLEQMAENLYKEWFVRFRFPGHENAEFENGLPKGWKIWSISKLCDINRKTLNSKNKGLEIEYLDTSSITCNQIVGTESYVFEEAPSRARRIVKHNSIVFSTVRPNLKHYGILKNIPDNLIVSTGFAVFDSKYDIANIIYLFLSSQEVVDYCQLIAEGAVATYPSIKPEEIGRLKVALPNIEIAENWNGKLESLYSEILNIQKQNILLSRQRDLLLPRLMSGKLEVNI